MRIPRIVIAGTGSGVGKTSVSIGLARALANRGMKVQTFKAGPDFLDPTHLSRASGRACYNLDGWMQGKDYARGLFARKSAGADIAIIEGVMGLFDGASAETLEGSAAEIAIWLDAPVLLVVNSHGVARTMAAIVKGCVEFEPGLRIAGVVANNSGTERHKEWLAGALASAGCPPLAGAIPRGALPGLKSRHLGLVTADAAALTEETLAALAVAIEKHLSVDRIIGFAEGAPELEVEFSHAEPRAEKIARIGIARDDAFHFYYQDALEALEAAGAELVEFSPVRDAAVPEDIQGVYFGGGYPEEYAAELSENARMLESVRAFAQSGGTVYAECGGLMYLSEGIESGGKFHAMAGILPAAARMLDKRKSLGYVEVELTEDSLWGKRGDVVRGHEFHYSELTREPDEDSGWRKVYSIKKRRGGDAEPDGFQKGNILVSYAHLHLASAPGAAECFVARCAEPGAKPAGKE